MLFLCFTSFGQIFAEIISKWSLPSFVSLGTPKKDITAVNCFIQEKTRAIGFWSFFDKRVGPIFTKLF